MNSIKDWKTAVIGAGTMGLCIAQHFAAKGFKTSLYNRTEAKLNQAAAEIRNNLEAMERMEALDPGMDVEQAMSNLVLTADIKTAVQAADVVFECVSEDVKLKKYIFKELDRWTPAEAYLCSDTSALNIYKFVETTRPDKLLITHFFNPAHVMPLVEIVKGEETPDETVQTVKAFLTVAGKKPIVINKCIPGFIFNRLLTALEREALYIVEQGAATYEDVDTVITTTFGPRFAFEGIFDLLDHVGLDTEAAVVGDLIPELCQSLEAPSLLLAKAEAGEYGIKTKKGFKSYENKDIDEIRRTRTINIIKTLRHIESL